MSRIKKIIFLIAAIILLLLLRAGNKNGSQSSPQLTPVLITHSTATLSRYLLGIGYSHFNPIPNRPQAMAKIKEAADIAYIQNTWKVSLESNFFTTLENDVAEARKRGLKIYLAMELLNPERTKIDLPTGLNGNFGTPEVQAAYIAFMEKIASMYAPDYLLLNVEANLLKKHDAEAFAPYPTLYAKVYDAVKKISPKTKVGVSLSLVNGGNDCLAASDFSTLGNDVADFPKGDMFAVSVYPMCYFDPDRLPKTFLADIATLSDKPLFISETGWISEGGESIGSETNQEKFIKNLSKAAEYAIQKGKQIEAINYIALIDPPKEKCDLVVSYNPALSWYCRLALLRLDGTEKPAYAALQSWKKSLR